jgi:hypothetical protein
MQDASLYSESFEAWTKRTGKPAAEWRRLSAALWAKIKRSEHYHFGRPCREEKCDRAHLDRSGGAAE